ncbi:MAG: DNA primase DnaG [Thermoplasmatales archaeon]|nr:DNA primase DnaG [Thermoplasmatales archaeon]
MYLDPTTVKYLIKARISTDGVVEKPDVVGAIFGQTEGLLGEELDLRDLQKSGRIGRIEVNVESKKGKSDGEIIVPSSLDKVETAVLASSLETIDRVGPCKAKIEVINVEDVRVAKRNRIVERAKELLTRLLEETKTTGFGVTEVVRDAVHVEEITNYGSDRCPAGPNIDTSDAVIIVEGRSDVLNLLKYGIKNAIAVEGTSVPKTIQELSKAKIVTVFVDGDRGGDLILRELLQTAEVDFVTAAPQNSEVEELTYKQVMKALRNKIPVEQYKENMPKEEKTLKYGEKVAPIKQAYSRPDEKKRTFHLLKPKQVVKKELSPIQTKYKETLTKLSGLSKVNVLDVQGSVVSEMHVRDLPACLKNIPENGASLVFDGIITQRMIDELMNTNIKTVVGIKRGNITKQPVSLDILTKAELE